MAFNEEETRYFLINPVLERKGYFDPQRIKLETPTPVEPIGPKGRRRKGVGRTDYLLCVKVGDAPKPMPVAVLEAKKEAEDPLKGMQQARGYADTLRFDAHGVPVGGQLPRQLESAAAAAHHQHPHPPSTSRS